MMYTHQYKILYKDFKMRRINLEQDIKPLSEFRAGTSNFIRQVNETHRPLLITQRGKGVAVLLDVSEYESMRERLEILEDIYLAESQLTAGAGIDSESAKSKLLERLKT